MIAGDQNADPVDGDSVDGAINQLLDHPRITDPQPRSAGGDRGGQPGRATTRPTRATRGSTPPTSATTVRSARQPARRLRAADARAPRSSGSGIFWPVDADPLYRLTGDYNPTLYGPTGVPTSDHRQVWVDLRY